MMGALICETETDVEIVGLVLLFGSSSKAYQVPGSRVSARFELAVTAVSVPVAQFPLDKKLTPTSQREKLVFPGGLE